MVAAVDAEFTRGVWIGARFDVLDVSSVYTDGHIVLRFTRNGTSVAADAGPVVDDESVIHHGDHCASARPP